MEDPNLQDEPQSVYNGEIILTLKVPIENIKGTPKNDKEIAENMLANLLNELTHRGVHLPLVLDDWDIVETDYADIDTFFDRADETFEENRDEV
jgi:arginine decarboxylase-like protein